MFCPNCGATNPDEANFCAGCGRSLKPSAAPVSVPAPTGVPQPVGFVEPSTTSGKAVGSLICGFLFFFFPAAIVAIVLGHLSLSDIRKSAGRLQGQGIAVAGLVLGYLGVVMIPFILIIAAIAIPNFLRAKMAANEASAVGSLRTIGTAASSYNATYSNGYPPSLDALGGEGEGDCDRAALLRGPLAFGRRNGYIFTYQARDSLGAPAANKGCTMAGGTGFTVTAEPLTRGTSGQRSFFIDETGVIRFDSSGTASAESQPLR